MIRAFERRFFIPGQGPASDERRFETGNPRAPAAVFSIQSRQNVLSLRAISPTPTVPASFSRGKGAAHKWGDFRTIEPRFRKARASSPS